MEAFRGEVSIQVAAPPEKVWAMVSDVTRMGEWSPETYRCEWIDGATGPAVGARFKGYNKSGPMRWSSKPTVVECEPGRVFAFELPNKVRWSYRFEPFDGGTRVTESFDVPESKGAIGLLNRLTKRDVKLQEAIRATLERVKAKAEAGG